MNTYSHHSGMSFEDVYPRAPFAELIRLVLSLADAVARLRTQLPTGAGPQFRAELPAGR